MTPSSPQVSVLIGVYNEAARIRLTIDSILSQTFTNWELIVVDDRSTDATFAILTEYAEQDSRISIYQNSENQGVSRSMNFALLLARAPLIARIDGDDEMLPERLARQVEFMNTHPEVGVLGTSALYVDSQGKVLSTVHFAQTDAEIRAVLPYSNPIINPSVMIRRQLLLDNPYADRLQRVMDYELWSRLISKTQFHNLQVPLVRYFVNDVKSIPTITWNLYVRLLVAIRLHSIKGILFAFLSATKMLAIKFNLYASHPS